MDKSILFGLVAPGPEPSLAELAPEMSEVLGYPLEPVPGQEMFHGGTDTGHGWLTRRNADNEPFRSHPFDLEFTTTEAEEPFALKLFDRLAESGRYRLMLVIEAECVRSTHFPCDEW